MSDVGRAEVELVARGYRLVAGTARSRGRIGSRRGLGPGSSLEFHDFRDYAPGDDLRHVDWRGFARTDQLRVRLHEAEVAPVVEVLVDTSPSMAFTDGKQRTLRQLVEALLLWARSDGCEGRAFALGGGHLEPEFRCDGPHEPQPPRLPLRPGSVRVLVADALWSVDAGAMLRRVSATASRLIVLQLLDPREREPAAEGSVTLVDCESGARASLRLDAAALRVYTERLRRLCDGLRDQVVRLGGLYAAVTAGSLADVCRRDLLPAGVVEPR